MEEADSQELSDSMSWEFPFKPTILMMLYSFAFYFFLHLTGGSSVIDQIGIALLALPVLIASLYFFDRFDVRILYKLALPLMVAGLLIHSQFGTVGGTIANIMTNASFVGFTVFAQIILCNICYRYNVRAIWLFGIVYAACMLAHIIGSCVGHWVSVGLGYPSSASGMAIILVVICLVLTSMLLLDEHGFSTTWGITPHARSDETRNEHSVILMSYYEEFVWRCARVSRHYGLTHREEEVLALLAQRKSIAAIESGLFISHGTAKGHVLHIYAKLGVHSRDEVAQIVESIT
jgi:DNA-binding CsgD family transcriptional regulator